MRRTETDELTGELYLVPPARFVAARDELIRQAHAAGHRDLAGELRGLRRPTLSAWMINLLVRHERASMDRLSAVGRGLRDAQTGLDTARLRHLAGQRQQLIADLVDRVRRRASDAGVRPSAGVLSEVEATLKAALVDLAATSTVMSGRLVRPLSHSGFGPMPFVPAPPPATLPTPPPAALASTPFAAPLDDVQGDGSVLDLFEVDLPGAGEPGPLRILHAVADVPASTIEEQSVHDAATALAAAEAAHWQREFELADAEGALDAARDRCEWLDKQRFDARRDRAAAERHLAEARSAQQAAVRAVEAARQALHHRPAETED